jgi:RimJ/RimL family protein N-acetyltransferase
MFDNYPIERIEAAIAQPFHATHRFVQKLGMKYEGTRRKGTLLYGEWVDQKIYSILREEV